MKIIKDILLMFTAIFIANLVWGGLFLLLIAIYGTFTKFIVVMSFALVISVVYGLIRYVQREYN